MDEMLDHHVGRHGGAHRLDLVDAQFARQHQLREAGVGEEARLRRRANVALRRGMQVDRRQVELQQAHVLDDQRVDAGVPAVVGELARRRQLVVAQDGVEGDVDAGVELVRERDEFGDVLHRIARLVAGAEGRAADVHRVGAVQDGFAADRRRLRRRQ